MSEPNKFAEDADHLPLVEQFVVQFHREFDFFDRAGRLVGEQLDNRLQESGIRAIVTSRAKHPKRLLAKLHQRAPKKKYRTLDDIAQDIVDLAGVRVALYFPGDRLEVDKLIRDQFSLVTEPKDFPGVRTPPYTKRFSGYWATHYRIRLREDLVTEVQRKYSEARIEIQVASVLMHEWAEVEHELVYKPLQGRLSEDEYAVIDELNGLVLAGEIALERLQRATQSRVNRIEIEFANHYELASFLFEAVRNINAASPSEPILGNVDLLFLFLKKIRLATPSQISPYIEHLHPEMEIRPVAQQIVDQLLAETSSFYAIYAESRLEYQQRNLRTADRPDQKPAELLGVFMSRWISFERAGTKSLDPPLSPGKLESHCR